MGLQHVVAMFGSTVFAPLLMGFSPNIAILMSGVGTLIFFLVVGGRVPSYLGSSFSFIGVVIAPALFGRWHESQHRCGAGRHRCLWRGVCGNRPDRDGHRHALDRAPDASGRHRLRGCRDCLNLPHRHQIACASNFEDWMAVVTFLAVGLVAVYTRGMVQRLLILVGLVIASVVYAILANGLVWVRR